MNTINFPKKMLREPEIPKDMKAAEKEELLFQLEDIVYELQDKGDFQL